ncbi:MAG: RNA polymerase sigma factor [Patescibacteria group bacterium]
MLKDCAETTDEEIVQRTLQDQEWYGCLVERYQAPLLRYIRRLSGLSAEDAEDILQEVFINAYRNLRDFDPALKFSSWIYRITRNATISDHRKRTARVQLIGGESAEQFLEMVKDERDVHTEVSQRLDAATVQRLIQRLDRKYADVLLLRYVEEKDYQEISDIMQKPVGTIGTLMHRAKAQLRSIIEKENIEL